MVAGCGKDNSGRISLLAEDMVRGGGAKVFVDPATPSGASWNSGETIDLNGGAYTITKNGSSYYLDLAPLATTMYALYPATLATGGNDIVVSNGGNDYCAVAINMLAVNFHDGGHDVVFPIAAKADAESGALKFKHLTGGLRLTLRNSTASAITVDTVRIGATNGAGAAIYKNLKPNSTDWPGWNPQSLPAVPGDEVGGNNGDVSAKFVGSMTLVMKSGGNPHVSIAAGQSITFCVPILSDSIRTISVTGYNGSVTPLFNASKTLTTALPVMRNKMYSIPEIVID